MSSPSWLTERWARASICGLYVHRYTHMWALYVGCMWACRKRGKAPRQLDRLGILAFYTSVLNMSGFYTHSPPLPSPSTRYGICMYHWSKSHVPPSGLRSPHPSSPYSPSAHRGIYRRHTYCMYVPRFYMGYPSGSFPSSRVTWPGPAEVSTRAWQTW